MGRAKNRLPCPYLAAHRKAQGMTQAQAALLAGCGLRSWKRWEGEGEGDAAALERVAEALGCSVDDLAMAPPSELPSKAAVAAVTKVVERHGAEDAVGAMARVVPDNVALIRWTKGQV